MYVLPRKLWFGLYVVAFAIMLALSMSGAPTWLWLGWGAVYMLFAVVTDPAPRRTATVRAGCDCARCETMRARHARRSSDVKDAG